MGRVWVAEDTALGRQVALKELAPALRDHPDARARLQREAWITAHLDHPGIVAVHDAGTMWDGAPFYTMRLVRGKTLAQALHEVHDLTGRQRLLRPLLAACEAVAYAHSAGVVHRDLKPENIMIGGFGEVQVVDWGLAVPVGDTARIWQEAGIEPERVERTVGTPAWMSPEQVTGGGVGPTSDVFSLGAMLHAILDGEPPYGTIPVEAQIQARRTGPPPDPEPGAPPELVAIARRATAQEPGARYADAGELANDLLNWFEGRPVRAHRYTAFEVLTRFVQVWRIPLLIGGAGLVAVVIAAGIGWARTVEERDRAREAEDRAVAARAEAERHLADALGRQSVEAVLRDDRDEAEALARRALGLAEDPRARGAIAAFARAKRPRVVHKTSLPTCVAVTFVQSDVLCLEPDAVSLRTPDVAEPRWRVAIDGAQVAPPMAGGPILVRTRSDTLVALDATSGATVSTRVTPGAAAPPWAFWSDAGPQEPNQRCGGRAAAFAAGEGGRIGVACTSGQMAVLSPAGSADFSVETNYTDDQEVSALVVRADGGLVVGTLRGLVAEIGPQGDVVRTHTTSLGMIRRLEVSPGGALLAVAGAVSGVHLIRLPEQGAASWVGVIPAKVGAAFRWIDSDTVQIADESLRTVDLDLGSGVSRVQHAGGVSDLSVDGDRLAVAVPERVEVVDPGKGTVRSVGIGPFLTKSTAWIPGQGALVAASVTAPHLWWVDERGARPVLDVPLEGIRRLVAFADGRYAWATTGTYLRASRLEGGFSSIQRSQGVADLEPAPDRRQAWVLEQDGTVASWDGYTYEPKFRVPGARAIAPRSDGTVVVALADRVEVRDAVGTVLQAWNAEGASIRDVAAHATRPLIAAGGTDTKVRVWRVGQNELLAELVGHKERVAAVEFGNHWLASGSWDHTTRLWDVGVLLADRQTLAAGDREP
jgi:WD40 repeat protein